jgi:hypothetical protein
VPHVCVRGGLGVAFLSFASRALRFGSRHKETPAFQQASSHTVYLSSTASAYGFYIGPSICGAYIAALICGPVLLGYMTRL